MFIAWTHLFIVIHRRQYHVNVQGVSRIISCISEPVILTWEGGWRKWAWVMVLDFTLPINGKYFLIVSSVDIYCTLWFMVRGKECRWKVISYFFKFLFPLILSYSPVFRLWTLRCSEKKNTLQTCTENPCCEIHTTSFLTFRKLVFV